MFARQILRDYIKLKTWNFTTGFFW
jgi:hypothetical protein